MAQFILKTISEPKSKVQAPLPPGREAIVGLSLSILLPAFATSSASAALPSLAQAFAASFQEVQWIVLAYLLAATALSVTAGRLGDALGRRRLLLLGLVLFTTASILCAASTWLWLVIAARAVQGLGAAMMTALAVAFAGGTAPKNQTGRMMGLFGSMSAIGTALGPSLGGFLIAAFGWRALFLSSAPLGVAAFYLIRSLPADRQMPKTSWAGFDVRGSFLLAITLGAYALAMTLGRGRFGWLNLLLLLAAAIGMALFFKVESAASSPVIHLPFLRKPGIGASLAMSTIVSTVIMASLVTGPFYLSRSLGLNASLIGAVLSAGPMAAALAGIPSGRAVDRLGAPQTTLAALVVMAAGATSLSIMPVCFGIMGYIAPLAVLTAGYALFQTANNTAVMSNVPPNERGVISGLLNLSRNLGLITGASVMGAVFSLASGAVDMKSAPPEAVAIGMRITFAGAALLIFAALAIAIAIHHEQQHRDGPRMRCIDCPTQRSITLGNNDPGILLAAVKSQPAIFRIVQTSIEFFLRHNPPIFASKSRKPLISTSAVKNVSA